MIYFIHAPRSRLVKIGYSSGHPNVRLKSLQCGSAEKLELIGMAEGGRQDETGWHRRFAHLRQHGEWFKWAPDLKRAAKPFLRATAEKRYAKSLRETAEVVMLLRERGRACPADEAIESEIERLQSLDT